MSFDRGRCGHTMEWKWQGCMRSALQPARQSEHRLCRSTTQSPPPPTWGRRSTCTGLPHNPAEHTILPCWCSQHPRVQPAECPGASRCAAGMKRGGAAPEAARAVLATLWRSLPPPTTYLHGDSGWASLQRGCVPRRDHAVLAAASLGPVRLEYKPPGASRPTCGTNSGCRKPQSRVAKGLRC